MVKTKDNPLMAIDDGMIELDSSAGKAIDFTSERFDGYLWKKPDYIYVSFIISHKTGNFRSLVDAIRSLGLAVKIPTPLGRMEEIVKKAGYRHTLESHELDGDPVHVWILEGKQITAKENPNE